MAASVSDVITDVTSGGTNPNVARVTATRAAAGTTLTCDNLAGWPTTSAVHFSTYRIDTSNNVVANSQTDWKGLVTSSTTIGSLTRVAGAADSGNAIGDVVEMNPTGSWAHDMFTGFTKDHDQLRGNHKSLTDTNNNTWLGQTATASAVNYLRNTNAATSGSPKLSADGTDTDVNLLVDGKGAGMMVPRIASPQGYLINGQITRTVASNNLTVALKTIRGNDPSAADPIYVRIGNTVRTISAALSVTLNAGTNWFGKGASYFATNESDYFVYLVWNTNQSAVQIAFSSDPGMRLYSDFSTTNTNWNYFGGTGTAPAATDEAEVIGRFNAILGATASFNWSLPATAVVVNYPIYETRVFSFTNSGSAAGTFYIKQQRNEKRLWGASATQTIGGAAPATAAVALTFPVGFFTTIQSAVALPGPSVNTQYTGLSTATISTTTWSINFYITVGTAGQFNANVNVIGT